MGFGPDFGEPLLRDTSYLALICQNKYSCYYYSCLVFDRFSDLQTSESPMPSAPDHSAGQARAPRGKNAVGGSIMS